MHSKLVTYSIPDYTKEKNEIDSLISKSTKVLITTHKLTDGDAVGSVLALKGYINRNYPNIEVKVVIEEVGKSMWQWWDNSSIEWVEDITPYFENVDLLILLDASSYNFTKSSLEVEKKINEINSICIDHHAVSTPGHFTYRLNISVPQAFSCCQLLADILFSDDDISQQSGIHLLRGMYSDMGGIKFLSKGGTNALLTIKRIMDLGNYSQIDAVISSENAITPDAYNLLQTYVHNTVFVSNLKNVPPFTYSFMELNAQIEKAPYEVNRLRQKFIQEFVCNVRGYNWGIVITEGIDKYKIGFRSLPDSVDVGSLAKEHFGGGGHARRSSGSLSDSDIAKYKVVNIDTACKAVLSIIDSIDLKYC